MFILNTPSSFYMCSLGATGNDLPADTEKLANAYYIGKY